MVAFTMAAFLADEELEVRLKAPCRGARYGGLNDSVPLPGRGRSREIRGSRGLTCGESGGALWQKRGVPVAEGFSARTDHRRARDGSLMESGAASW